MQADHPRLYRKTSRGRYKCKLHIKGKINICASICGFCSCFSLTLAEAIGLPISHKQIPVPIMRIAFFSFSDKGGEELLKTA
jgi:hypothetical protein